MRYRLSTPLILSFSELSLFAVLALGVFYSHARDGYTAALREQEARFEAASERILQLESERDVLRVALAEAESEAVPEEAPVEQQVRVPIEDLKTVEIELQGAQDRLKRELDRSKTLDARVNRLERDLAQQVLENTRLQETLESLLASLPEQPEDDVTLRRELLGIRGSLDHVVFVFDRSSSIRESRRWEESIDLMQNWVRLLEMQHCGAIVFGRNTEVFNGGAYLDVMSDSDATQRDQLLAWLETREPEDGSNLLPALRRAHAYPDIDSIILITDGGISSGLFSLRGSRSEIYAFIDEQADSGRNVPINVIGVGSYFTGDRHAFLRDLATRSGGSFTGR